MLSQSTVVASLALADALASRNLSILPKPNTILSELNRATNAASLSDAVIPNFQSEGPFNAPEYGKFIETITGNMDNPTLHDKLMDGYLDDLRIAVSSHISFARNVVKPVVIDFGDKIRQRLEEHQFPNAESQFIINVLEEPEPLKDVVFLDALKHYEDKTPLTPSKVVAFKAFNNDDELLQYILTGEQEVDAKIVTWFGQFSTNKSNMIESMLTSTGALQAYVGQQNILNINHFMLLYLTANALLLKMDHFREDANLSNTAHKDAVVQYRDFAGVMLCKLVKQMEMYHTSGMIVLEKFKKTMTVLGDTYRSWLENGGSTEQLLASAIIETGSFKTAADFKRNEERLVKEWNAYQLFYSNSQSNQRLTAAKQIVGLAFHDVMQSLHEEEKAYVNQHAEFFQNSNRKLDLIIEKMRLSDLDNLNALALKIICQCRFYYTDAEFILSEIEEVAKHNPGIDIHEAAMIATIHYLVDYICYQMYLTPKM